MLLYRTYDLFILTGQYRVAESAWDFTADAVGMPTGIRRENFLDVFFLERADFTDPLTGESGRVIQSTDDLFWNSAGFWLSMAGVDCSQGCTSSPSWL